MFKKIAVLAAATGLLCSVTVAGAEDRATKKEAESMVKKAVAAYKADGENK